MEQIRITISATLAQTQLGTIAAANIAKAFYQKVTGGKQEVENSFSDAVELAVGEACTNSVKYCPAMNLESSKVTIIFEFHEDELVVKVQDCNPPVEFNNIPAPDFENAPEHGYGIHIMKECMDQVSYQRLDGWNVVTLRKRIQEE